MPSQVHRLRHAVGIATLLGLALAPFIVHRALTLATASDARTWPAFVAVTTATGETLTSVSLVRVAPSPMLIQFPRETAVDVPNGGRLRASTAFKIGGPEMVQRALAATLTIDVAYYMHWNAASLESAGGAPVQHNLKTHLTDATSARVSPAREVRPAPGRIQEGTYFNLFVVDVRGLLLLLSGAAPPPTTLPTVPPESPSPSPSPTPTATTPDPARITIQVLNQGAASGAATRLTQELQDKGFLLARVGDSPSGTVNGDFVYYTRDRALAEFVAGNIDRPTTVQELPRGYTQSSDVVVVLGRPRTQTASRSGGGSRSTPNPGPTEPVVVATTTPDSQLQA